MAKKRKVGVKPSKAFRRQGHDRAGTRVLTSEPMRIKTHARAPRRTQAEIDAAVRRHQAKSLAKKRDLPLRDQRALKRRGKL